MTDWHRIERWYTDGERVAARLRDLLPRAGGERQLRDFGWLDRDGVLAAWGQRADAAATIVRGVRRSDGGTVARGIDGDPGAVARRIDDDNGTIARRIDGGTGTVARRIDGGIDAVARRWVDTFERAVAVIARQARAPVVALGGGLDGAAVLKAWRASGIAMPAVTTIATGLAGYDEVEAATAIAMQYGCRCDVIDVTPDAIVRAIPEAAAIGETPLYNLHPVTRLVLARELAARGHDVLVTGDGGDAVFAGVPDHDYVPIVAAYTRAYLSHASPYVDPEVSAATPIDLPSRVRTDSPARDAATPIDRRILRDYVGDDRPKRARMMPAIDLVALANRASDMPIVDPAQIERLARAIDLPPAIDVRWVTLDHAVRALVAERVHVGSDRRPEDDR